jgi:hypothetical protein
LPQVIDVVVVEDKACIFTELALDGVEQVSGLCVGCSILLTGDVVRAGVAASRVTTIGIRISKENGRAEQALSPC